MFFLSSPDLSKSLLFQDSFRNTIRVSDSCDPDQAHCPVGPDLGLKTVSKVINQ